MAAVACLLAVVILQSPPADAGPLLSHFKLNGNGEDALGNSPPMDLSGVTFTNDTLALPENEFYTASSAIAGFSYASFTIAFDFRPCSFDLVHRTLLSGGPAYRWIGLENDSAGRLLLSLNNRSHFHSFTNVIATNQWHTLVCSVDLPSQAIVTVLDGERLSDIALQNFQFEVVGTSLEEADKVLTFWNSGDATSLCGQADNLRIYNRALTMPEIESLFSVSIAVSRFGQIALIHWSADLTGYTPEWTASLLPSIRWLPDGRTPVIIGDQRILVDTLATGTSFYRLRRL